MVSSTFTIAHLRTGCVDLSLFSYLSPLSDGNNPFFLVNLWNTLKVCVFFFLNFKITGRKSSIYVTSYISNLRVLIPS